MRNSVTLWDNYLGDIVNGKKKLIQILVSKQHDSRKSWNQICKIVGLSPSVVSKFIHTQSDISVESLNKLLRYFNVDIYHSSRSSLLNRQFDTTLTVPVIGISNEYGMIYAPRMSDPNTVLRSNIWRGYNCIIVRHDPIYNYQCLFDPTNNFKKNPESVSNQYLYSILKYKCKTKNNKESKEIFVFCNVKFYPEKKIVSCLDEVTKTEVKVDIKDVIEWFAVEAIFAPNTFKSSRTNSLHDQVYNQPDHS